MWLHELGIKHQEAELKKFHCMARIPVPVDTKRMETSFKKGLLKVCIPRVRQTLKAKSTKRLK
jgi:HSP20 family molecular chaperone IbpA